MKTTSKKITSKKITSKKITSKKITSNKITSKKPTLQSKVIDFYNKTNKINLAKKAVGLSLFAYGLNSMLKTIDVQQGLYVLKKEILKVNPMFKKVIGETFQNKYTVKNMLGTGAYGKVSIAKNNTTNKDVIIKEINIVLLNQGNKTLIENELSILKKLSKLGCKYTTCYIDHQYNEKNIYIIFSYDYPDTLDKLILNNTGINNIDKIIKNLICGLHFLHSNKIAHSDIKPQNIIFNKDNGDIKYIDFGISCENTCSTVEGSGTALFLSPEMIQKNKLLQLGQNNINLSNVFFGISITNRYKQDIWALGVVIYLMLYKKHPYVNDFLLDNQKEIDNLVASYNQKIANMKTNEEYIIIMQENETKTKDLIEKIKKNNEDIFKLSKDTIINYNNDLVPEKYNNLLKAMLDVNTNTRKTTKELIAYL